MPKCTYGFCQNFVRCNLFSLFDMSYTRIYPQKDAWLSIGLIPFEVWLRSSPCYIVEPNFDGFCISECTLWNMIPFVYIFLIYIYIHIHIYIYIYRHIWTIWHTFWHSETQPHIIRSTGWTCLVPCSPKGTSPKTWPNALEKSARSLPCPRMSPLGRRGFCRWSLGKPMVNMVYMVLNIWSMYGYGDYMMVNMCYYMVMGISCNGNMVMNVSKRWTIPKLILNGW